MLGRAMASQSGKSIIVTGANSGLGFHAAKQFCGDGYNVILACRNETKARAAVDNIKYNQPDALATHLKLDLTDFASVRACAAEFQALGKPLYALVNNAGIMMPRTGTQRHTTPAGHEVTMAANYLGHFLLTQLLLEDLKRGAETFGEARVVNVASSLQDPAKAGASLRGKDLLSFHSPTRSMYEYMLVKEVERCPETFGDKQVYTLASRQNPATARPWGSFFVQDLPLEELNLENFNFEREGSYCGINAYMNSKSALIMMGYTLAETLHGTGVTVNTLCPGFIPNTNLSQNHGNMAWFFMKYIFPTLAWLSRRSFTVTVEEGSRRVHELTTSDKLQAVSGKYYCHGEMAESQGCTNDVDLQRRLWDFTMKMVGLDGEKE